MPRPANRFSASASRSSLPPLAAARLAAAAHGLTGADLKTAVEDAKLRSPPDGYGLTG